MVVFMSMPLEAHGTSPPTLHVIDVVWLLRAIYITKVCNMILGDVRLKMKHSFVYLSFENLFLRILYFQKCYLHVIFSIVILMLEG